MKLHYVFLLVLVFMNTLLMLFFIGKHAESTVAGIMDINFIIFGTLFLIVLVLIFGYIFARTAKAPVYLFSSKKQ